MTQNAAPARGRTPRYLLAGIGIAVVVLLALCAYLFSRIEPSDYVELLNARVKQATGRSLTIAGKVGFTLSLLPTVSVEDIRFQNAPWGTRPDMLRAKRVEVAVALLPLIRGTVEIRAVELIEPDLLLETSASGEPNWIFEAPQGRTQPRPDERGAQPIGVQRLRIADGVLTYRDGKTKKERRVAVDALTVSRTGDGSEIAGRGRMHAVPLELTAKIRPAAPGKSGGAVQVDANIATAGAKVSAAGSAPFGEGVKSGLEIELAVEVTDWDGVAKLAERAPLKLPPLKAAGVLRSDANAYVLEKLSVALGKSSATGSIRFGSAAPAHAIDVKLEAAHVDLAELLGPPAKPARTDNRLFSAEPFALEPLRSLDARVDARIARLVLRDGKPLDGIDALASFDHGKVKADPVHLRVGGKALRMRIGADASSGRTLVLDASIDGSGIALGALASVLNLGGTVEGAATDLSVRLNGRGNSVRALIADASGDVRIVVGPGRIRSKTLDLGADVTELLNVLNPARATDPYTELRCAVVRLPIRRGVIRIDNGIAVETAKVNLIAAGVIDLRNETLDLGFRPKAVTGLGIGLGGLASLARLRGSFADPSVEADFAGAASAASQLGLAAITGGLSLLAGGMLTDSVPEHPCQAALAGNVRAGTQPSESKPSALDEMLGGIKRIFQR